MGDFDLVIPTVEQPVYDYEALVCRVPARSDREAVGILEIIGGAGLGTGLQARRLGIDIPVIRTEYERRVAALVEEVGRRQGRTSLEELARYASRERTAIARNMRWRQGAGTTVLLELRDQAQYGLGGRSYSNMSRRYYQQGLRGADIHARILRGATTPNVEITASALRGARYLRHGGRVIIVVGLATTAYTLLTTPEEQLPRVMAEEAGGMAGGALGTSAAVGLCLIFGVATAGWGLLACGVVGGMAGGYLGSQAGNRLYYAADDRIVEQARTTAIVDPDLLWDEPPLVCR